MNAKELETLHKRLLKEQLRLQEELDILVRENLDVALESRGGDNNYEDDLADSASNVFDRERDLSLERNVRDLLGQVKDALKRIDAGTYGVCSSCHKKIGAQRMRALPYAELCVDCKSRQEGGPR